MNLHTGSRARAAITLIFAAVLVATAGVGAVATVAQEPLPEACAFQERAPHNVRASDPLCETDSAVEAAACIYYGTPYKQEVLVTFADGETRCLPGTEAAAVAEAAGWPNFDPSDMTREIAQYAAQQEAAAWPNFDPTDMTREIAQYAAQQEAAAWPNYDSTAIYADALTASTENGPRMTQIAAEEGSEGDVAGTSAPYAGSANQRSVELTESREAAQSEVAAHQQSGGAF